MAKRYIPNDVFESGACLIADTCIQGVVPAEEALALLWDGYKDSVIDDGVLRHWLSAGTRASSWLEYQNVENPEEFIRNFWWYVLNYDEEGNVRKKRLFNGLLFSRPEPDEFRDEHFLTRMKRYYMQYRDGEAKLAPSGWFPGGRT